MAWQPTVNSGEEIPVTEREELEHLRSMVAFLKEDRDEARLSLGAAREDLTEVTKRMSKWRSRCRRSMNKAAVLRDKLKELKKKKPATFFGKEIKPTDRKSPKRKRSS